MKAIYFRTICEVGVGPPEWSQFSDILDTACYRKALLIDPDPGFCAALRQRWPDPRVQVCENAVIEGKPRPVEMINCSATTYVKGIKHCPAMEAGYDHTNKDQYFLDHDLNPADYPNYTTAGVPFSCLDDGEIDVLAADCEGSEWFVLQDMRSRPWFIRLETSYEHPYRQEIANWLAREGYEEIIRDGSDTLWKKTWPVDK
jgi:hypothetical protein